MGAYEDVTNRIVAAIESGLATGKGYRMPWHSTGGRPVNVASGRAYRGINVLMLWGEAQERGFSSPLWGTFKQWQSKGAKVKKGAKASLVVFWKDLPAKGEQEGEEEEAGRRFVLKTSWAFNAAQVEGYEADGEPAAPHEPSAAERLIQAAGVDVRFGGGQAFYHPRLDYVQMPPPGDFVSVPAFQSVLLHEAAHWTGHQSRLERDFTGRFGSEAYAFEELVAELTAAWPGSAARICTTAPWHSSEAPTGLRKRKCSGTIPFTPTSLASPFGAVARMALMTPALRSFSSACIPTPGRRWFDCGWRWNCGRWNNLWVRREVFCGPVKMDPYTDYAC